MHNSWLKVGCRQEQAETSVGVVRSSFSPWYYVRSEGLGLVVVIMWSPSSFALYVSPPFCTTRFVGFSLCVCLSLVGRRWEGGDTYDRPLSGGAVSAGYNVRYPACSVWSSSRWCIKIFGLRSS